MKKIIIACVIIGSFITAKVGYNEYQDWEYEKYIIELDRKEYSEYMDNAIKSDLAKQYWKTMAEARKTEIKEYEEKMNTGFWRSIFNAF
jgi:hypothetical protein